METSLSEMTSDASPWGWKYSPVALDSAAPAPLEAYRTLSDSTHHPECLTKWLRQSNAWHRQAERFQRMIAAEDRVMNKARWQ